ncbi:unnamed protein product [Euphydryas editha]|uniref:CUB domain-containing protein n=1 Tax=Euphydryas editha TaxID=104508 RepID=A0AAU9UHF0_EUPED|nr:unnamed protein product [Euphydryas editha]
MFKFWIFVALIAISASRALSLDDDGEDHWFDEYWYEDLVNKSYDADVKESTKSTPAVSSESTKTSPATTAEDHNIPNINDYLFEDVRSELEYSDPDDNFFLLADEIEEDKKELEDSAESDKNRFRADDDIAFYRNESEKKILEETKTILDEDREEEHTRNDFDKLKSDEENEKSDSEMLEETSKLLRDTSDLLGEDEEDENKGIEKVDELDSLEETIKEPSITAEDDTVSKAVEDLMTDIDKLNTTWNKLIGNDNNNEESPEIGNDGSYDYEEIDDDNLNKIFESILKEHHTENVSEEKEIEKIEANTTKEASQEVEETYSTSEPILYLNDALIASEIENSTRVDSVKVSTTEELTTEEVSTEASSIADLSSAEVNQLMEDFKAQHQELLKISSTDVRNAINIRLTVDEPIVVTSPDYPSPYPTDNTVDWYITGDGLGIELNITDFHVNGFVGDYVLVKPGGVDVSGSTGLLFSYELTTERRYRFLDVDQMFIRFYAARGMRFRRGFRMSMRMVVPRPGAPIEEIIPDPEPVIPTPAATITLNLGGISLERFIQIEEQFRKILADMATIYINTNNIDPGLNTT